MNIISNNRPLYLIIIRNLLCGYLITGGLLMLLALLLYRFGLTESIVSIAIILIYIISTFFSGFLTGRKIGTKKYIWGFIMGILYFVVMILISLIVNHSLDDVGSNLFTTFLLCAGAGMLGGMLS